MLEGYVFVSETDTEVLAHLLADVRKKRPALSPAGAVRAALRLVTGAFGVAVVFADQPDLLIGARHGSPLLLGVGCGEYFLASDASAIVEHTSVVEYLAERELVVITRAGYTITSLDAADEDEAAAAEAAAEAAPLGAGAEAATSSASRGGGGAGGREPKLQRLELTLSAIEKGGFEHFMAKEIFEQPSALRNAMRGRVLADSGEIRLGGLAGEPMRRLCAARRVIIAGCGTSFHSAQVGEYLIEGLARVPCDVEYASELRYRRPILRRDEDVLIAISQSGETADTLAAVREAKAHGVLTLGLVNAVGSSIARETDAGCYLHVGPEIGVASTKAFTAQVLVLAMLALAMAREKGVLDAAQVRAKVAELAQLPALVEAALEEAPRVLEVAREYRFASSFLFLGRGANFPVALEGALKLKECSYIHAEGLCAAELKHGPLALVEKFMPVVAICPRDDPVFDKLRANVEEVLARGGSVLLMTQPGADAQLEARCDAVLRVPAAPEWLAPIVHAVPLQLLAYYIAVRRGCDVDRPRNLAKSVTVE